METVSMDTMLNITYTKYLKANKLYERVILQNNLDYIILMKPKLSPVHMEMITCMTDGLDLW